MATFDVAAAGEDGGQVSNILSMRSHVLTQSTGDWLSNKIAQ